jgi:putative phage-type endonuclease
MLTADQIQKRFSGIGGSDAAAIAGVSPWTTPYQVWESKVKKISSNEETPAMRWGSLLEPVIAQEYSHVAGVELSRSGDFIQHPKHKFMIGYLDGFDTKNNAVIEIKTAGQPRGWGEPGTDEIPSQYLIQVAHYVAITGADYAEIAVLIGSRDFRIYRYNRNPDLEKTLIETESRFWEEYIETETPPPPLSYEDAIAMFPLSDSNSTVLTDNVEILSAHAQLKKVKEQIKELEQQEKKIKGQIGSYMGGAEILMNSLNERLARWQTRQTSRLDTSLLKEERPDIYQQYLKTSEARYFTIY